MTVKQLKAVLADYPDDMECKVGAAWMLTELIQVISGVDMDTNQTSVWLCGK